MRGRPKICFFKSPALDVDLARKLLSLSQIELKEELDYLFELPHVNFAIRASSPSFYESFKNKAFDTADLYFTLMNYIVRMCLRPTAFGIMASTAVGELSSSTDLTEGEVKVLKALPENGEDMLALNPTIFKSAGKLYFYRWVDEGPIRRFKYQSLELDKKLEKHLNFLKKPLPAEKVYKLFGSKQESKLVASLKDAGVLVDAFGKTAIGNYHINEVGQGTSVKSSLEIYNHVSYDSSPKTLSIKFEHKARKALSVLNSIYHARNRKASYHQLLDEFKKDFLAFYEDHQVPLLECIDSFRGVGFSKGETVRYVEFPEKTVQYMAEKIYSKQVQETGSWELTNEDATKLSSMGKSDQGYTTLSRKFSVSAKLGLLDHEDGAVLKASVCGSYYAPHYRWSILSNELASCLTDQLPKSDSNFVYADIEFYPGERSASYIRRGPLAEYYIPITGFTKDANAILMSDILVSVNQGFISLWSKKLKRYVIPLPMHNYNFMYDPLPAVRFLSSVARQDCPDFLKWVWPQELEARFLPRVSIDGIILSPKTWRFSKTEFLTNYEKTEFRSLYRLDKFVNLRDGDSFVTLDLDDHKRVEKEVKRAKSAILNFEECWQLSTKTEKVFEVGVPIELEHENDVNIVSFESLNAGRREFNEYSENFSNFTAFEVLCSGLDAYEVLEEVGNAIGQNFFYIFYPSRFKNKTEIRFRFVNDNFIDYAALNKSLTDMRSNGLIFDFSFKSYETDFVFFGDDIEALTLLYIHASDYFRQRIASGKTEEQLFLDYAVYTLNLADTLGLRPIDFNKIEPSIRNKTTKAMVKSFFVSSVADKKSRPKVDFPELSINAKEKVFFRMLHMNGLRCSPLNAVSFESAMAQCLRVMGKNV